jgi:hypothetical protein
MAWGGRSSCLVMYGVGHQRSDEQQELCELDMRDGPDKWNRGDKEV